MSTREVGSYNYMNWEQIKELQKENFVEIGNHSHSHEYLIDENASIIRDDILRSIKIFEENLGKIQFFSYPFGEYSIEFKNIIKDLGFKYAFGQHSGVMDDTKNLWELPRFPINEKYGDLKRFKTLMKTLPLKFKDLIPEEKYIDQSNNPPKVKIEFFEDMKNLKNISCYSNEENVWRKSEINFININQIEIKLNGKFIGERGRINCSLNEGNGYWRWLEFNL